MNIMHESSDFRACRQRLASAVRWVQALHRMGGNMYWLQPSKHVTSAHVAQAPVNRQCCDSQEALPLAHRWQKGC